MKRSVDNVESDVPSPPPPRFTYWSELITEMQSEIVSHLDCGTRECLALTARGEYGKWHPKEFDNPTKRVKHLAREAPMCYLSYYINSMCINNTRGFSTVVNSFIKGIVQGARLYEHYIDDQPLHVFLYNTMYTPPVTTVINSLSAIVLWTASNWKYIGEAVLRYGSVDDFDLMKTYPDEQGILKDYKLAFASVNIPVILAMTDDPRSPLHTPRKFSISPMIDSQYFCFGNYLSEKATKRAQNWELLFEHPTWKAWLEEQNGCELSANVFIIRCAQSLKAATRAFNVIPNHVALFKFIRVPQHLLGSEAMAFVSGTYFRYVFTMGDIISAQKLEVAGIVRPALTSDWIAFETIVAKIVASPNDPMLDWLADNGYLTVGDRMLNVHEIGSKFVMRNDKPIYALTSFGKNVTFSDSDYKASIAWFGQHRLPAVRAIADYMRNI